MARRRFKFTFPPELIQEPIIYEVGRRFEVVTNIRRAEVTATFGWVVLELDGTEEEITRAVAWVADRGVRVDPVEGDVVAG
jgi:ABC-type methionine transport system ATPase subunit